MFLNSSVKNQKYVAETLDNYLLLLHPEENIISMYVVFLHFSHQNIYLMTQVVKHSTIVLVIIKEYFNKFTVLDHLKVTNKLVHCAAGSMRILEIL